MQKVDQVRKLGTSHEDLNKRAIAYATLSFS